LRAKCITESLRKITILQVDEENKKKKWNELGSRAWEIVVKQHNLRSTFHAVNSGTLLSKLEDSFPLSDSNGTHEVECIDRFAVYIGQTASGLHIRANKHFKAACDMSRSSQISHPT